MFPGCPSSFYALFEKADLTSSKSSEQLSRAAERENPLKFDWLGAGALTNGASNRASSRNDMKP